MSAYTATAFIILVLGGFILLNLILNGLFFFAGKYHSKRFSQGHTIISLVLPAIALIWTLINHVGFADLAINMGLIVVAVGLSLLPLQLSLHQKEQHSYTSLLLTIGAAGFLALSYLIQPIAIFAIAAAHVAFISNANIKNRVASALVLICGYLVVANWGVQTWQAFTQ
ncbi:hypothetical protein FM038_007485 [Shewanella eurypsychrophilus]|uniref:Uncharacterized protein n=1 Tax=Shewanella eurypsychrophilus TaxID=2593656 RepID=A0ABX6V4K7_9GAMM|nr:MULTISPECIES: hypothetical protein [Shewanella]QFU22006.1 hypothetical protein FS418_09065 [Shewanella sp. YLB-09]QPG57295.1 hypothetical protein FM038_007485 [Shewanella eurypsychrophilus]